MSDDKYEYYVRRALEEIQVKTISEVMALLAIADRLNAFVEKDQQADRERLEHIRTHNALDLPFPDVKRCPMCFVQAAEAADPGEDPSSSSAGVSPETTHTVESGSFTLTGNESNAHVRVTEALKILHDATNIVTLSVQHEAVHTLERELGRQGTLHEQ